MSHLPSRPGTVPGASATGAAVSFIEERVLSESLPSVSPEDLGQLGPRPDEVDVWSACPQLRLPLETVMRRTILDLGGQLHAPLSRMVEAGGKQLRPALTLTIADLAGGPGGRLAARSADEPRQALQLAAAVELLHCATLIHDDLIDGSKLRRGVPAVSALEGTATAVVAGDLLIAAASMLAGRVSQQSGLVIARTLVELCRGEALEEQLRFNPAPDPVQLLDVIRLKTGSLLRAACLLGAQAASAGAEFETAAAEFGMEFGISLQLIDDLLDVVSSPLLAGKPVGADFAAGTVTMPALLAIQANPELADLLGPVTTDASRQRMLALLRSPEAIRPTVQAAQDHAEAACRTLSAVSPENLGLRRLSRWPLRYLRFQLLTKVAPELRFLIPRTVTA
jgi:heptaprenyl diphosphate synthase